MLSRVFVKFEENKKKLSYTWLDNMKLGLEQERAAILQDLYLFCEQQKEPMRTIFTLETEKISAFKEHKGLNITNPLKCEDILFFNW